MLPVASCLEMNPFAPARSTRSANRLSSCMLVTSMCVSGSEAWISLINSMPLPSFRRQVDDDQIRADLLEAGEGLGDAVGLGDDVQVRLAVQQQPEALTDDGVIVHNHHRPGRAGGAGGRRGAAAGKRSGSHCGIGGRT